MNLLINMGLEFLMMSLISFTMMMRLNISLPGLVGIGRLWSAMTANGTHVCEVVNLKKIMMKKAEEILREYIEFDDINGSILIDILEEYASQFRKHDVSGSVCWICGDELSCLICTNPLTEQIKL